jgi:hypothetical protein
MKKKRKLFTLKKMEDDEFGQPSSPNAGEPGTRHGVTGFSETRGRKARGLKNE